MRTPKAPLPPACATVRSILDRAARGLHLSDAQVALADRHTAECPDCRGYEKRAFEREDRRRGSRRQGDAA